MWQMVKARAAEKEALQQKAESDEIADIVIEAIRRTDLRAAGKVWDPDEMRDELLRKVEAFRGNPGRKAEMLIELSVLMRRPTDIRVFRQVLKELEPRVDENDPLLWSLRYRVALKTMHATDAAGAASREARGELYRILAWQSAHLGAEDTQPYNTKFALAAELLEEVGTPEALREAEELLRSCVAHYERKRDTFDIITCNIELMSVVFDQSRQEEALKLGRETCRLAMKTEGEDEAITARAYGRLAKLCREAELFEESITHARHALDIYWHTVGPGHGKANATLDELAEMLEKKGDSEAVLQLRRASLSAGDQQLGSMSPDTQWQAARVVEALRDLHRLEEAHALAGLWLERVRVEGRLPAGAASLLVDDFLTLQDLGRKAEAEELLRALPEALAQHEWNESASHLLKRWESVAASLNNAGRPAECIMIVKHVIQALEQGDVVGRKAMGMRPEFEKLLHEAERSRLERAGKAQESEKTAER